MLNSKNLPVSGISFAFALSVSCFRIGKAGLFIGTVSKNHNLLLNRHLNKKRVNSRLPVEFFRLPEVNAKSSGVSFRLPEVNAKSPEVFFRLPEGNAKSPEVSFRLPEGNAKSLEVFFRLPEVNAKSPDKFFQLSEATVQNNFVTVHRSTVIIRNATGRNTLTLPYEAFSFLYAANCNGLSTNSAAPQTCPQRLPATHCHLPVPCTTKYFP